MMHLFFNNGMDMQDLLKECKALTFEKYVVFCKNWFKNLRFDFLILGNTT